MPVLVFWKPLNKSACNGDATVDIVDVNVNVDVVNVDIVDHLCEDPVEPLQGPVQVKLW